MLLLLLGALAVVAGLTGWSETGGGSCVNDALLKAQVRHGNKRETFTQCWLIVGPASETLYQH